MRSIFLERFQESDFELLDSWVKSKRDLIQFAGSRLPYPLSKEIFLDDIKTRDAFVVKMKEDLRTIGHAQVTNQADMLLIGRVLIGEESFRGKELGLELIHLLLKHGFSTYDKNIAELNVYSWNVQAIKCYEKAGFILNTNKISAVEVGDESWIALNMQIERKRFEEGSI